MNIKLIKRIKFMMRRWKHNDEMFSKAMDRLRNDPCRLCRLMGLSLDEFRDICRRADEKLEKNYRALGLKFEPRFPDVHPPSPVPPPPPPPPPPSPEENLRAMVKTLEEIRDILTSRELD